MRFPESNKPPKMPVDFSGTWDIVSNDNFEGYMIALGIDFATRKIAAMLKPQKVIKQDGDCFTIKTLTTFRNYESSFKIGEEVKEVTKGMDNRSCQTVVSWENEKLVCVQKGEKKNRGWTHWFEGDKLHLTVVSWQNEKLVCVQKGEKKNRGWTHWFEGDKLHLEFTCEDQVCKIIYGRTPQAS